MRLNAPQGVLTEELKAEIAERKQELLQFLHSNDSGCFPPAISRRVTGEPPPLSFAQERLWLLEQLEPGSPVYNICRAFCIAGELSIAALEKSLTAIVDRHEVLRSAIRMIDERPVQVVQHPFELKVQVVDLKDVAHTSRDEELKKRLRQAAEASFDFRKGNFLRAEVVRLAEREHVLILSTHHIAADAWSMGLLTRELWAAYQAYAAGSTPSSPELAALQYADYALWQREWLREEVLSSQLGYWKKQLNDLPIVNLPIDHPRPPRQSFRGARVPITLPESLTSAINDLSNACGVTPFMTLVAAFQVLLYRYSGQENIVVGAPVANRRRAELEPLIGFFVNTLVLRADLSGNPAFKELLARVRDVCLDAYRYQDLPFEKLVQELQPERDRSRNPLFQVMFALQNATKPISPCDGLSMEPIEFETGHSLFDLSLVLRGRVGNLIGFLEYSTDLFDRTRIERMAGHFKRLLDGIIANPTQPISTLSILTESERHQVLVEWNDTTGKFSKDKCIHELFEEQVERVPEAVAVELQGQNLTYQELNNRANQLAHYLQDLTVGPEKRVAICLEISVETVVAILGILKSGGAYVALDPDMPNDRLACLLRDVRPQIIITQQGSLGRLAEHDSKLVCLDTDWPEISRRSQMPPACEASAMNLAYVVYTSGSTGQPKGVMVSHQAVCNHFCWMQEAFSLTDADCVVQITPYTFDVSVWEILGPLSIGAKLVLAPRRITQDPNHLLKLVTDQKVTIIQLTPSLLRLLDSDKIRETSVRYIFCGGESLPTDLWHRFSSITTAKLHNVYGPTETTIDATCYSFNSDSPGSAVPIGRPISNVRTYVLDQLLQPIPVGIPGELYIGGEGLSRGYLNLPELSAEKFLPDPFSDRPGARIYKTGDLARYLPNGNIETLGRIDDQVKIRGYRIELGEVETILNRYPSVKACAVSVYEREADYDKILVAYVVPYEKTRPSVAELRGFLNQNLPNYMAPSAYFMIEALPLMPNGKVDRRKLSPPPTNFWQQVDLAFVPPRDEIEKLIAQIWHDVMEIDAISVHENFFAIGGHSLKAIQILSRLQHAFHVNVPLRVIFDTPTIAGLAEIMEGLIRQGLEPELPSIVPVSRNQLLPLSLNQEQLWAFDRMMPGTHFFNVPIVYWLGGTLNAQVLERAIIEVIRRHDALRTVFDQVDGHAVQVISSVTEFELPVIDLRGGIAESISDQTCELILNESLGAFDLTRGPLIRAKLLRFTDHDYILLLTAHHIICDDWSIQVLRGELVGLYDAFSRSRASPFSKPTLQFADYAVWERRLLENGLLDKQLDYWRKQLRCPLPSLMFQHTSDPKNEISFITARAPLKIDEMLFTAVKNFAHNENCTVFMVLLTAINIVLYLYTREEDIRIGTLVANRARSECEGSVGYFLNTVILRTRVLPELTVKELVRQVRTITLAAFAHQNLPFEKLARVLKEENNISRSSLFQVLFNYQNASPEPPPLNGLSFAPLDLKSSSIKTETIPTAIDLIINLRELTTKLMGTVNYRSQSVHADTMAGMITCFTSVLGKICLNVNETVLELSEEGFT